MRRKWQRAKPKEDKKKFRANQQIGVPEVFLIDENGETVGNIPTEKALAMAREIGLDLVELVLKGRERQHPEKAQEVINNFIRELEKDESLAVFADQGLTRQGGRFNIILTNKNNQNINQAD